MGRAQQGGQAAVDTCRLPPGVQGKKQALRMPRAQVWFDPGITGPRVLIRALDEAGYPAEPLVEGADDGSAMREREKQ